MIIWMIAINVVLEILCTIIVKVSELDPYPRREMGLGTSVAVVDPGHHAFGFEGSVESRQLD